MAAGTNNGYIYNCPRRLEKNKQALAKMKNGQLALALLDHLLMLGLSVARVSKYSAHLRTILRQMNFTLKEAKKRGAWKNPKQKELKDNHSVL